MWQEACRSEVIDTVKCRGVVVFVKRQGPTQWTADVDEGPSGLSDSEKCVADL